MRNSTRIITVLSIIATLCSCSLFKSTQKAEEKGEGKSASTISTHYTTPQTIATNVRYEVDLDTLVGNGYTFELPESMNADIDSLLNSWQARNMLHKSEGELTGKDSVQITDTMYAKRLAALPTIVRMPYNNMVRTCIDRYTKKGRSQISYLLGISEYYFPIIEEEIDRIGVPRELKYLPIIESALNPKATSRAGAKGLWQFMFTTGKLYGLRANNYIDERFDPAKATTAALLYLKDLYEMFQNWELAIAAYNCGPGNVNKALRKADNKGGFWDIYQFLPKETRGYVPAFIAATYAYHYHKVHDIVPTEPPMPLATDTVHIRRIMHLEQIASTIGTPIDVLRALNPQLKQDIVPAVRGREYDIVLPVSEIGKFLDNEAAIMGKDTIYLAEYMSPRKNGEMPTFVIDSKIHKVQSGENLSTIARKYGVTVKQICKWNNIKDPSKIRIGQKLEIFLK